eukprot:6440088-Prymnesium_polylepis.1
MRLVCRAREKLRVPFDHGEEAAHRLGAVDGEEQRSDRRGGWERDPEADTLAWWQLTALQPERSAAYSGRRSAARALPEGLARAGERTISPPPELAVRA